MVLKQYHFSAAMTFGKFKDSFLAELHAEILSHEKQETTGQPLQSVAGIIVHDSDVLQPEPVRQGGLMRKDAVSTRNLIREGVPSLIAGAQKHTFRQPTKPLAPPTPRSSVLGLDRLAQEKRALAASQNGEGSRKRARLDDDRDGPVFKGTFLVGFVVITSPLNIRSSPISTSFAVF